MRFLSPLSFSGSSRTSSSSSDESESESSSESPSEESSSESSSFAAGFFADAAGFSSESSESSESSSSSELSSSSDSSSSLDSSPTSAPPLKGLAADAGFLPMKGLPASSSSSESSSSSSDSDSDSDSDSEDSSFFAAGFFAEAAGFFADAAGFSSESSESSESSSSSELSSSSEGSDASSSSAAAAAAASFWVLTFTSLGSSPSDSESESSSESSSERDASSSSSSLKRSMSSSKSSSMRPVRHTEVDPLWRTVTVSPALNVSPDPSVNWSAVPIVREPIASSGESWVLTKTVTRSRSLGFRPSATWVITMESPSSAANFFACDDERSGTGRRRSAGGSVRERRCGARPAHRQG